MVAASGTTDPLDRLQAPAEVTGALRRLRDELQRAAGGNLAALVLYGGLARGRFRPGHSDVNVLVLLREGTTSALDAIAPALRAAFRAATVEPFLLTTAELAGATDVFPTKLLDIQEHHLLLAGEDPFGHFQVAREHIRLRVEQELRNLCLRLRRQYVAFSNDDASLFSALARVVVPLSVELATVLRLSGRELPGDDSPEAVLAAAARAFDLDEEALAQMAALKQGQRATLAAPALYGRILATLGRATELVDALEGGA